MALAVRSHGRAEKRRRGRVETLAPPRVWKGANLMASPLSAPTWGTWPSRGTSSVVRPVGHARPTRASRRVWPSPSATLRQHLVDPYAGRAAAGTAGKGRLAWADAAEGSTAQELGYSGQWSTQIQVGGGAASDPCRRVPHTLRPLDRADLSPAAGPFPLRPASSREAHRWNRRRSAWSWNSARPPGTSACLSRADALQAHRPGRGARGVSSTSRWRRRRLDDPLHRRGRLHVGHEVLGKQTQWIVARLKKGQPLPVAVKATVM